MIYKKRIAVVLPACLAARTLEKTVAEIPKDGVDIILGLASFRIFDKKGPASVADYYHDVNPTPQR